MKKYRYIISALTLIWCSIILNSCNDKDDNKTGFVTFGANYDIINSVSTATVFIDNAGIGVLNNPTDLISDCGELSNITKELPVGRHVYKVEIRPQNGNEFAKDINGIVTISEGECEKIFIDYNQIFNQNQTGCNSNVIISESEYENAPNDPFTIEHIRIDGNCIKIKFNASGCDGSTWNIKLIDSGDITGYNPYKRTLRLSLDNKEECTAVPSVEATFNIKDLQIDGNNKITLNISGEEILYVY